MVVKEKAEQTRIKVISVNITFHKKIIFCPNRTAKVGAIIALTENRIIVYVIVCLVTHFISSVASLALLI